MSLYLFHKHGQRPCHRPAFIVLRKPIPGDLVVRDCFRHLDGSEIEPSAPKVCGSCGFGVAFRAADVEESDEPTAYRQ